MRFVQPATISTALLAAGNTVSSFPDSDNNKTSFSSSSRFIASSMTMFEHPFIDFVHLDSVDSTQEEVKRRIQLDTESTDGDDDSHPNNNKRKMLAISAQQQVMGRGTSGRKWIGHSGNMFLTMGIPMERVLSILTPPTLLPLQMGILVAQRIQKLVEACSSSPTNNTVHVKWPNDVLLNGRKVAGILIESITTISSKKTTPSWFLIGIGINIMEAPNVPQEGPDRGRPAISIRSICGPQPEEESLLPLETNQVLAQELAISLHDWLEEDPSTVISTTTTSTKTLQEWKDLADWSSTLKVRETGEQVMPLELKKDGSLLVRGENGQERTLVADYLY